MMKLFTNILKSCFLFCCVAAGGCASKDTLFYQDPEYAKSMYDYLRDEANLDEQIEYMTEYFEDAGESGKKVAPGAYGHMAALQLRLGNISEMRRYMELEKKTYPESAHYIDFLLNYQNSSKKQSTDNSNNNNSAVSADTGRTGTAG